MDKSTDVDAAEGEVLARLSTLEDRLARLEHSEFPKREPWLIRVVRSVAMLPLIAIPVVFLLQWISDLSHVPFGFLCCAGWAGAILAWLVAELFIQPTFRFSLARLLLVAGLFYVFFGFWSSYVLAPYRMEQRTLDSLHGLSKSIHREPFGPNWLRWLTGDKYFERVVQLEIAGPETGDGEIPKLYALKRLRCVFLTGPNFTDEGLFAISQLPDSVQVIFTKTRVTKVEVQKLQADRPNLEFILQ